jgi:hypothetical protein
MREGMEQVIEREISQTSLPYESSLTQINRTPEKQGWKRWQWMRHFFSEDRSPDNQPVIELQRRAVWIGLALILQALNEIPRKSYLPYVPFLNSWSELFPFFLILGSLLAMWMGFRPNRYKRQAGRPGSPSLRHTQTPRWQRVILIGAVITSIGGGILFGQSIVYSFFMSPVYSNDGTSLDTNAAMLLVQGHNPFTDSNILPVVRQFALEPNWTTPLRVGQFANLLAYPSASELRSVMATDLKAGYAPEFESKVSYPALSFLTLVPFIWLNINNVLAFYLFCYIVLVAIAWKVVQPELRPWVLLLSLANVSMWGSVVGGNLDVFTILLVVVAWLLRDRGWWSALFLGLALASKQISWFFLPFYAIMIWRQYSFMEAVRRLAIASGLALAINIPFILWNPHAWLAGIMAPMSDPMFPMGVGIISLSSTPLLPLFPQIVYDVLELGALLIALAYYWRLCTKRPEAAMVLAIIPLFFAWRSLPSYFNFAALSLFILTAARALPAKSKQMRQPVERSLVLPLDYESPVISDIPDPAGIRVAFRGICYLRSWAMIRLAMLLQG